MRDLYLVFCFIGTALLSGGIGFITSQKLIKRKTEERIQRIINEMNNLLDGM